MIHISIKGRGKTMKVEFGQDDEFHRELGALLRQHRLNADMSQLELARLLGCHLNTVSNYERGLGTMPIALFCRICDVLDLQAGRVFKEVVDKVRV
jgi:transcriptional regulator with XRE-family HTH domain